MNLALVNPFQMLENMHGFLNKPGKLIVMCILNSLANLFFSSSIFTCLWEEVLTLFEDGNARSCPEPCLVHARCLSSAFVSIGCLVQAVVNVFF